MRFAKRNEDGPSLDTRGARCGAAAVAKQRIGARRGPTYLRTRGPRVCLRARARALVLHARMLMIVLQNERSITRPGPHRGPDEVEEKEEGEERIEEANSTGQAAGSAGPALGPTGGPGVTFQDGCA